MRARRLGPLALVLVTLLTGCIATEPPILPGQPSGSPLPSVPAASVLPSSAETSVPAPSSPPAEPTELRIDGFAQVIEDGVRVRSEPFVGDASKMLEPLLWNGATVFVIAGPVAGSGYAWYLVEPMPEAELQLHPDPPAAGWVAVASRQGQPWLAPLASRCARSPLGWLQSELLARPIGLDALSCFGDRSLQFMAGLSIEPGADCRGTTGPWTVRPSWLGPCPRPGFRLADPEAQLTDESATLPVAIPPNVDLSELGPLDAKHWLIVDVVGQYAHPAAAACQATPTGGEGEGPPRPEVVVLDCRAIFVVTSIKAHADT